MTLSLAFLILFASVPKPRQPVAFNFQFSIFSPFLSWHVLTAENNTDTDSSYDPASDSHMDGPMLMTPKTFSLASCAPVIIVAQCYSLFIITPWEEGGWLAGWLAGHLRPRPCARSVRNGSPVRECGVAVFQRSLELWWSFCCFIAK